MNGTVHIIGGSPSSASSTIDNVFAAFTITKKTGNGTISSTPTSIDGTCHKKICARNYRKDFCQSDFEIIDGLQSNQMDSNSVAIYIDNEFNLVDSTHEVIKLLTYNSEKTYVLRRLSLVETIYDYEKRYLY